MLAADAETRTAIGLGDSALSRDSLRYTSGLAEQFASCDCECTDAATGSSFDQSVRALVLGKL